MARHRLSRSERQRRHDALQERKRAAHKRMHELRSELHDLVSGGHPALYEFEDQKELVKAWRAAKKKRARIFELKKKADEATAEWNRLAGHTTGLAVDGTVGI